MPRTRTVIPRTRPDPAAGQATGRQVRYGVAMSLDGYIAGPDGEYDWIVMDPEIDFEAIFRRYDTFVMGRKTFQVAGGAGGMMKGASVVVFSRTLDPAAHPGVTIVAGDPTPVMADLRRREGKDIWLFGGGELFRAMLAARQVDGIDAAIIPVVLGGGVPFLPAPADRVSLRLTSHRIYGKSGIVSLGYDVAYRT